MSHFFVRVGTYYFPQALPSITIIIRIDTPSHRVDCRTMITGLRVSAIASARGLCHFTSDF